MEAITKDNDDDGIVTDKIDSNPATTKSIYEDEKFRVKQLLIKAFFSNDQLNVTKLQDTEMHS